MNQSRRRFLQSAAATSAIAATGIGTAHAQSSMSSGEFFRGSSTPEPVDTPRGDLPFLHGVASGDPIPDSVILWTRVTPSEDAMPGSGAGEDVELHWEVATDEGFGDVVASGQVTATAAQDHTVHVDPHGLQPETVYFYRFIVISGDYSKTVSPVGRTRTAPHFTSSPESMRFAVASCANWESGFFSAYRDMAQRGRSGDLDFTLFLGDYIYEYETGYYSGFGPYRLNEPAHETVTLADYRVRYGQYRTDGHLQAAHAALPWIVVWDDHEIANNNWREGAENHDPETQGDWKARRDAAMQAYFEWLPVRATSPSEGGHIYRSFTFGDLAELTVMDLRTYRDQEGNALDVRTFNDPNRTMLGSEQAEWLEGKISTSDAAWNILGNSVMFSPMNLITLDNDQRTEPVSSFLSSHRVDGIPLNSDQWDGYSAARRRLLELLDAKDSKVLFCTGDIHTEWGHTVSLNGRELGAEVVCASISAPNVNEILLLPEGNGVSRLAQEFLRAANPHINHVELDSHGFAIATVHREHADMEWIRVADLADPNASAVVAHSWRWG